MYLLLRWSAARTVLDRTDQEALSWVFERQRLALLVALIAAMLGIALLWPKRLLVWPVIAVAVILGATYTRSLPFVPWGGLRAVPGLKLPVIVGCWMLVTVVMPFLIAKEVDLITGLIDAGLVQLPLYLANALLFDIRDLATDDPSLRTIPQVIGARWTRVLIVLLLVYIGMILLVRGFMDIEADVDGATPWADVFAGCGSLLAACFTLIPAPKRSDVLHETLADGILLLIPALYLIGSLL